MAAVARNVGLSSKRWSALQSVVGITAPLGTVIAAAIVSMAPIFSSEGKLTAAGFQGVPLAFWWVMLLSFLVFASNVFREGAPTSTAQAQQQLEESRTSVILRTQVGLAMAGVICLVVSLVLLVHPPQFDWQRFLVTVIWVPFNRVMIDFPGLVGGLAMLILFSTGCLFCGCCGQCFGRVRLVQRGRRAASRALIQAEPFVDLVESRAVNALFTPLLFVFGFALPSSFVIASTALIPPYRVFPRENVGSPFSLEPLCRTSFTSALMGRTSSFVNDTALGWVSAAVAWGSSLEPLGDVCHSQWDPTAGRLASRWAAAAGGRWLGDSTPLLYRSLLLSAPFGRGGTVTLPPFALAVRDTLQLGVRGVLVRLELLGYDGTCSTKPTLEVSEADQRCACAPGACAGVPPVSSPPRSSLAHFSTRLDRLWLRVVLLRCPEQVGRPA